MWSGYYSDHYQRVSTRLVWLLSEIQGNREDGYDIRVHYINLLKPTGHVMHQQFNIQQLYVLPTLYLSVLYLSENKQRIVPLTAQTDWFL